MTCILSVSPISLHHLKTYQSIFYEMPTITPAKPSEPIYFTNLGRTIDRFFSKEKSDKQSSLQKLISGRTKTLKATVLGLLDEIETREKLDLHILNNIDDNLAHVHTNLHIFKSPTMHYTLENNLNLKQEKRKLEEKVIELEHEKRQEYLECWRDLKGLRRELLSAFKEYWDLLKRRKVLFGK